MHGFHFIFSRSRALVGKKQRYPAFEIAVLITVLIKVVQIGKFRINPFSDWLQLQIQGVIEIQAVADTVEPSFAYLHLHRTVLIILKLLNNGSVANSIILPVDPLSFILLKAMCC